MSTHFQPGELIAQENVRAAAPLSRQRWDNSVWSPLLLIVLPLSVVDFSVALLMNAIPQSSPASVIVYACLGLIPAQAALLTMALVFSKGAFWRRLLIYWGCVAALISIWALGVFISLKSYDFMRANWRENVVRLFCSLPAVSLMIQLPLWLARGILGWRFVRVAATANSNGEEPISPEAKLSIRDLFWATAIVGLTLGIARLAPGPGGQASLRHEMWLGIAVFSAIFSGVAAFSILPLMWLFSRKASLTVCWLTTLLYALFLETLFLLFALSGVLGMSLGQPELIGYTAVTVCFAGGIASGLTLLRQNDVYVQRGNG